MGAQEEGERQWGKGSRMFRVHTCNCANVRQLEGGSAQGRAPKRRGMWRQKGRARGPLLLLLLLPIDSFSRRLRGEGTSLCEVPELRWRAMPLCRLKGRR